MITQEEIPPFTKEECKAMLKTIYQLRREKKELIDRVCEWLKSYRQETPDGTGYIAGIVNDKTIEDLRKAMEE